MDTHSRERQLCIGYKKLKIKMKKLIWIVIAFTAAGFISYALFFNGGSEPASGNSLDPTPPSQEEPGGGNNPPSHEEPAGEAESQEEPVTEPDPGDEPIIKPGPDQKEKPATKPEQKNDGQQQTIPVPGKEVEKESIVIESGTIENTTKQIALTFDAGWLYDQTGDLLDVLDYYQVKSTFFLRGKWVEDHPDLAREIIKRGHSIGNHSLTHGHMTEMTDEEVQNEIVISTNIIEEVTGYRPCLFRPPFGEYDSRILKILSQQGYPYTVKWTVDSLDWAEEMNGIKITEQYLIDRVLSNATDKGIILMHVGGFQTVDALPEIIEGLLQEGYHLMRVNDMLTPKPAYQ